MAFRRRGGTGALGRVWGSSLPLRIIATTLAASILVLIAGGWMILSRARDGILEGKRQASIGQASVALTRMQNQLRDTDLRTAALFERLNQLAEEASGQRAAYHLVIRGPVSGYISRGIDPSSVPEDLEDAVAAEEGLWLTPTLVEYTDSLISDEPGLAIGGRLHTSSGDVFPVYFIFPLTQERATIDVLNRALASTVVLLLFGLAGVAYLVSRQVTSPIRQASEVAGEIASGDLDQRMPVRGTDDLASLATSMNNMATELQSQITKLESLSRLQQQFVSDVSHELRTPLTTVRMAAEVLYTMRDEFGPTASRTTELLQNEIDRFEALLADLLEISRFDAGAALLSLETMRVSEIVRVEVNAHEAFADRMGTELRFSELGETSAEVDGRRIQRIIRNLITNAIEHGDGKPIDVTVAGDNDTVAVTVRDRGIGFEANQSQLVFHRFWRADPSRNRTIGGTGLGLAISREDARLHNGWLQAWGSPGAGALFRLTLPRTAGGPVSSSPLPLQPVDFEISPEPKAITTGRGLR